MSDTGSSEIHDAALTLRLAQEQDRAMIEQYAEDDRPEHEVRQWNAILDANARLMWRRDRA